MQLAKLQITNFKGLADLSASLTGVDGSPRPITLVLGDNGSGKTTLLQAIALVIGLATRRLGEPSDLTWPGFLPERMSTLGATRIELEIVFGADELERTMQLHKYWAARARPEIVRVIPAPSDRTQVRLCYEAGALSCAEGPAAMSQFLGRFFTKYLLRTDPALREGFPNFGDVFWFDQNRNLTSIEQLREYLVQWWSYHISPKRPGVVDYLARVEEQYAQVFPGARFDGTEPRSPDGAGGPDSYVWLQRKDRRYDIAEMSSGEQAVFPILYQFVRQSIGRSIVLIDELELHLHPPEQQGLLASLRRLGPGCQFIVTTHSPYLEAVTPPEEEVRLEGGQRCL